jgi:hypothetical protein
MKIIPAARQRGRILPPWQARIKRLLPAMLAAGGFPTIRALFRAADTPASIA